MWNAAAAHDACKCIKSREMLLRITPSEAPQAMIHGKRHTDCSHRARYCQTPVDCKDCIIGTYVVVGAARARYVATHQQCENGPEFGGGVRIDSLKLIVRLVVQLPWSM